MRVWRPPVATTGRPNPRPTDRPSAVPPRDRRWSSHHVASQASTDDKASWWLGASRQCFSEIVNTCRNQGLPAEVDKIFRMIVKMACADAGTKHWASLLHASFSPGLSWAIGCAQVPVSVLMSTLA